MSMSECLASDPDAGPKRWLGDVGTAEVLALLFIVMIGAVVRLYHIGWQPLWVDEGFSEWASRQSVWYLWTVLPTFETNPPLYYTLLKGWRFLFGDSEAALRSLSALFSVATIPLVFAVGRMVGDRRSGVVSGLMAAVMFAFSPSMFSMSRASSSYSFLRSQRPTDIGH